MTNRNPSEPTEDANLSESALLAEYQVCQREASDAVSSSWQSGIILFVTTLALAGTIISGLLETTASPYRIILVFVLGVFSIALLLVWKKYLTRQHFIRRVMFYRMQEIERKKGLRKCLYVSFLDETLSEEDNPMSQEEKENLSNSFKKDAGRKPRGFVLTIWVIRLSIGAWIIILVLEILSLIFPRIFMDY